jgi:hypothetical protein
VCKKCTLVQALRLCTGRTALRGSRGIALLFLDHGTRRGEGSSSHRGRSLPRERPGTHCAGGWVGPRAGLDRCGKSRPTWIRSPDRPARCQSLYRLSYPVHCICVCMYVLFMCVLFMYLLFVVGLLHEAVRTRIVACLSPWTPLFDPRPVYVTATVKNSIRIGYYPTRAVFLCDYHSTNAPYCLSISDNTVQSGRMSGPSQSAYVAHKTVQI